jgi:hypothetical protein
MKIFCLSELELKHTALLFGSDFHVPGTAYMYCIMCLNSN